jgi:hypothetical protein
MPISFSSGGLTTWAPGRGRSRPIKPKINDNSVIERTEAGNYRVSDYGVDLVHQFVFKDMLAADYDGDFDWATHTQTPGTQSLVGFYFAVGRMKNTFTFTDEAGVAHTVRFLNPNFSPSDSDSRNVSVSFNLIEENYL